MEDAAEEVLPPVAGQRSAAALRLHPEVRTGRQGRRRRARRAACTIDPESLNGSTAARRVKGTIHWVSAAHAVDAEVRLYDRLFQSEDPGEGGRDPLTDLNPESLDGPHAAAKWNRCSAQRVRRLEIPVRAAGLLLRGPRFAHERAGVQPHGDAQGHLGEDQRQSR